MMKWLPITFQNLEAKDKLFIDWLHDYILVFLIFVVIFVGGVLIFLCFNKNTNSTFLEASSLEFMWTILPGIILIFIGAPSLGALYEYEFISQPDLTVKITGHQWYWTYDYSDFEGVEFDSYLKPSTSLMTGEPRLLETDNHFVLPLGVSTRLVISSSDVLHSWAMPSCGLKVDANPGRMNTIFLTDFLTSGLFYGQCSEICGANHSFMPICLETTPFLNFGLWMKSF